MRFSCSHFILNQILRIMGKCQHGRRPPPPPYFRRARLRCATTSLALRGTTPSSFFTACRARARKLVTTWPLLQKQPKALNLTRAPDRGTRPASLGADARCVLVWGDMLPPVVKSMASPNDTAPVQATWLLPWCDTRPLHRRGRLSPPEQGAARQPARSAWPPP